MGACRSPCSPSNRSRPSIRSAVGRAGRSRKLAHHDQVFEAAQMRVQMRLFGHVAHALLPGDQVAPDGFAVEQNLAAARLDEAGDHLHGGGFAGAVRPEVAGHLAGQAEKLTLSTAGCRRSAWRRCGVRAWRWNTFDASAEVVVPARGRTGTGWSHRRDLNPRPAVYKTAALPAELRWPASILAALLKRVPLTGGLRSSSERLSCRRRRRAGQQSCRP